MRKLSKLLLLFTIFTLWSVSAHAQQNVTASLTTQATACASPPVSGASGYVYVIQNAGNGGGAIAVSGTWSGTLSFFRGVKQSNSTTVIWSALSTTDATPVSTATANGTWQVNTAGYTDICVAFTTDSSGTAVVTINLGQASARSGGSSSGGGGAFPQTVSGTVNSGGIPCFTSTTSEVSSATIIVNDAIVGGGSGACVKDSAIPLIYNGTTTNLFIGPSSGNVSATGTGNMALGIQAGASLTVPGMGVTTGDNIFFGNQAGQNCTSCRESTFIGYQAGQAFIGNGAGIEDGLNTFIGSESGLLDQGISETFIGQKAGVAMADNSTNDEDNTFIGVHAGSCFSSGKQNVIVGRAADSGSTSCTGNDNTYVGYNAADATNVGATNNTCIGQFACQNLTTGLETMIGSQAGQSDTSGAYNFFGGYNAGQSNVTGSQITDVGEAACQASTGANITCIGQGTATAAAGDTNEIVIGEGATGAGSNTTTIGNSSTTSTVLEGQVSSALGYASTGVFPTITGCGTISATAGGATTGTFTTSTTGTCTAAIPMPTAAHGWVCIAQDITKHVATNILVQSATSASSCTVTGTTAASDVITFAAFAY